MVDPVSGSGGVPPLNSINRTQATDRGQERREQRDVSNARSTDEVVISEEALSLQQAEQAATETRELLQNSERAFGIVTDDL